MEQHIDWLVACMCRGFALYDANEAYADSADRDCQDRHLSSGED